jgi:hypothetical protein
MLTIIDLNAEFANLNMLQDRTPQTTAAERDKAESFARLMSYRADRRLYRRHPLRHPNSPIARGDGRSLPRTSCAS